jgi:hypothetical protein
MKNLRVFVTLLLLAGVPRLVPAQEAVPWNAPAYNTQFKYFQEQQTQDQASWAARTPEDQKIELDSVQAASLKRQNQMVNYYNAAMEKWDSGQLREYLNSVKDRDLKAVSLWLGQEQGAALSRKFSLLRDTTRKSGQGLNEADLAALEPYLKPDAINEMKAQKPAADSVKKSGETDKDKTGMEPSRSGKALGDFAGTEPSKLSAGKFSSLYDGSGSAGKDPAPDPDTVNLQAKNDSKLSTGGTETGTPRKKLTSTAPPALELTNEFKGIEDYAEINKKNKFTGVMEETDKDGASGGAANAAKSAALKSVFQVSKDFDETFINNPSPKNQDVRTVIDKIKDKAKNPDDAWNIARQMRNSRDFPALRDAEHYLWSCAQTTESKWSGAATLIVTPLYSAAKLPGLRKIFFDDTASPPSVSEITWGVKGVKDCWK